MTVVHVASTLQSKWCGHGAQGSDESREEFLGLRHLETGGWQALSCRCAGSEARGDYAAERWGGGLVQRRLACAALLSPVRHRHGLEDDSDCIIESAGLELGKHAEPGELFVFR